MALCADGAREENVGGGASAAKVLTVGGVKEL